MSSDMLAELRTLDLADADRDENTHRCDCCGREGTEWAGLYWLCAEHAGIVRRALNEEVYQ